MSKSDRLVYEYGYGARIGAVLAATAMWALALSALGGGVYLLVLGQPVAAGLACLIGLIIAPYCVSLQHSMRMKHEWRVSLRPGHVTLCLPANRASHHHTESFEGEVGYRDIHQIVRRREVYSRMGIQTTTMPYWLVLKDGRKLLLGEDRNPGDGEAGRTTIVARSAEAISRTSGIQLVRAEPGQGRSLLFGLLANRPPAWPQDV